MMLNKPFSSFYIAGLHATDMWNGSQNNIVTSKDWIKWQIMSTSNDLDIYSSK